ncbi:hypothetical protein PIB30_093090, partial [Stylosanthes scabra]|nr:hypothetical protein [Stylosanthes scabra]
MAIPTMSPNIGTYQASGQPSLPVHPHQRAESLASVTQSQARVPIGALPKLSKDFSDESGRRKQEMSTDKVVNHSDNEGEEEYH